jgi:hypothetical protein
MGFTFFLLWHRYTLNCTTNHTPRIFKSNPLALENHKFSGIGLFFAPKSPTCKMHREAGNQGCTYEYD